MSKLLEDCDKDGRVATATNRITSMENTPQDDDMEEGGSVLDVDLSVLIKDASNQLRRGRGHLKSREQTAKERRAQAFLNQKMVRDDLYPTNVF